MTVAERTLAEREGHAADGIERQLLAACDLPLWGGREAALRSLSKALAALTRPPEGPRVADVEAALGETIAARDLLVEGAGPKAAQIAQELRTIEAELRVAVEQRERLSVEQRSRPEPPPVPPLRASLGTPSLHAFRRPPLAALGDLLGPWGGAPHRGAATRLAPPKGSARAQVWRLARDCMEDLANLSELRRRGDAEPWASLATFEQRLLSNLDALVALARGPEGEDVLAQLVGYAAEMRVPDRGRAFALAFGLGCIDGDDAVRAAVIGLKRASPATHGAFREAFCLASSPAVGRAMERLLGAERSALVRLALDVLRHRREATLPMVVPLLDSPDPHVAAGAARAASVCVHREALRPLLAARLDDPGVDDEVLLAALEGLLQIGAPEALPALRERLRAEIAAPGLMSPHLLGRGLLLLAMAGASQDLALLLSGARLTPAGIAPLGWFGHPAAIDPLLALVEAPRAEGATLPDSTQLAAAHALFRITGAGPRIPTGEAAEPMPAPLAAPFRAFREEHRSARPLRLRFGRPYTLEATLEELERGDTSTSARREASLELSLGFGSAARLEVDDWAARQKAVLALLRTEITAATPAFVAGEWLAEARGSLQRRGR
jgi:hypothetical protein